MMYPHPMMQGMPPPPPPPSAAPAAAPATAAASRGPTPTNIPATAVPSHLPPGVKVPTPRAVSLDETEAGLKTDDAGAEAKEDAGVKEASTTAPPSLSSTAPPSRPESVEPQPEPQAVPTVPGAAPAPAPDAAPTAAAALDAMMLAAATVAGTASTAGAAGVNGNRLPAEEVASFLMTLKHRSISPDHVDDTASCLASMKMPHLMPTSSMDSSGDSSSNGAGGTVSLGPGSVQTTDGQVLKFRETARPLGLPMATPEDRFWLSDVSCFVRAHCCEFFVAEGQEDNLTKTRSKSGKVSFELF